MDYEAEDDILYLRRRKMGLWTVLLVLLALAAVVLNIRIRTINVKGNRTYTAGEAVELIFSSTWDYNSTYCFINQLRGKRKELPFIADYEIDFKDPFSCDLIIYEKNPIGCVHYMSNYMYFDKDGVIIESAEQKLPGVPVIKGLQFGHVVLGKKLPVNDTIRFNEIMNITQQMSIFGIGCDSISFDTIGNATVLLDSGDVKIEFGTDKDLSAKVSALNDMLPKIRESGLKGTLDLSGYDDSKKGNISSFHVEKEEGEEE